MTGDRPAADGGPSHASLFASFPAPLLAYASAADLNTGAGTEEELVVHAVNAAFESTFDASADEITGTPLSEVELGGKIRTAHGGSESPDDPLESDRRAGDDDPSAGEANETGGDSATTAPTLRSLLDRTASAAGASVRFHHVAAGDSRQFRVQAFSTESTDVAGYLLFTDVTELEAERRDLAGTVDQLERIASVASHDLRNPLEVATIRLEAAQDTGEDVHFEKVAGALDRIEHIARDVLGVGGGRIDPTDAVSLETVAEAAWDTVDTADARLVTAPELPTVRGDADRLQQLFENLFRNAVEHGGPDVTVTVEPIPDGFAVTDDGPGIPADVRERVFEAGYSTASGNTGLGLSIVGRIAREHGWQVSLASAQDSGGVDDGARFAFTGIEDASRGEDVRDADDDGDR